MLGLIFYRMYPKYLNIKTPYHILYRLNKSILVPFYVSKYCLMSAQQCRPRFYESDPNQNSLLRPIYPNTLITWVTLTDSVSYA